MATLTEIQTRCRDEGEMGADGVYVGNTLLNGWINSGIADLHDRLSTASPTWFLSSTTIALVAGTEAYALPATFESARGVDLLEGGTWRNVDRFLFSERNSLGEQYGPWPDRSGTEYRIEGGNIRVAPAPSASGSLRLWYVTQPVLLSSGSDVFAYPDKYLEFVVICVLLQFRTKEESDVSALMARKGEFMKRIEELAHKRDRANPGRVRDVRRERMWRRP